MEGRTSHVRPDGTGVQRKVEECEAVVLPHLLQRHNWGALQHEVDETSIKLQFQMKHQLEHSCPRPNTSCTTVFQKTVLDDA
jgi:hypothetical protein